MTNVGFLAQSLSGTAEAGATIQLLRADIVIDSTTTADSGDWRIIAVTMNEGANVFTAKATDAAGNESEASNVVTITFSPVLSKTDAKKLNETIVPRLVQIAVASTMSAVNHRIDATFSGIPQVASYQFDGQTVQLDSQTRLSANLQNTVEQKLPTYIKSLKDGTMNWKEMLSRSSFVIPLNAWDRDGAGTTVWGSGDYHKMSGKVISQALKTSKQVDLYQ